MPEIDKDCGNVWWRLVQNFSQKVIHKKQTDTQGPVITINGLLKAKIKKKGTIYVPQII